MSIVDHIRALFGEKSSGAEHSVAAGAGVAATSDDDPGREVDVQSGSGGSDGGGSGDGGGAGGGDGGGATSS